MNFDRLFAGYFPPSWRPLRGSLDCASLVAFLPPIEKMREGDPAATKPAPILGPHMGRGGA